MSLIDDSSDFDTLSFGHMFYVPVSHRPDVIFGSSSEADFETNMQVMGRSRRSSMDRPNDYIKEWASIIGDPNRSGLIV